MLEVVIRGKKRPTRKCRPVIDGQGDPKAIVLVVKKKRIDMGTAESMEGKQEDSPGRKKH